MGQHSPIRNLASRNAGKLVLMDLEYELRSLGQPRFTVDGIHFDTIEGQAWMSRVFQERLDELEFDLTDTGVLSVDAAADVRVISTPFVAPSLETRLGSVVAVSQTGRSSRNPETRSDAMEQLDESPARRPVQFDAPSPSHAGAPHRAECLIDRRSLMWTRPRSSPWYVYN